MTHYKINGKPAYQCRCGIVGRTEAKLRGELRKAGIIPDVERYPVNVAIEKAGL